jgi:CRP-like cAMP-binding protein
MKKNIFHLLNAIALLSPGLEARLRSILHRRKFLKGEYILKEGMTCQFIYFIESGLIRIFNQLAEKETTSWFLKEDDIFISVSSFFGQQPSSENIIALEDCVCWGINYDQLRDTCMKFPEFNIHRIAITESYYARSEDRQYKMLRLTPEERYAHFVKNEPELLSRVPVHLLPSYLDIPKRTFERIRSNYNNIKRKGI